MTFLHFDFYHVGEATNGWKYILLLKNCLTYFVELIGCSSTSTDVAVKALHDWFMRYSLVPLWVSDQPTHFKNKVLDHLRSKFLSTHRFTTAYCAWANGRIERVNRDLGELFRIMLPEYRLPQESWHLILWRLQYAINHTKSESLCGYAPVELFTGHKPSEPLNEIFNPLTKEWASLPSPTETLKQQHTALASRLRVMHKEVQTRAEHCHGSAARQPKQSRAPVHANFELGDWVLWSRVDSQEHFRKTQFMWRGPFEVTNTISDHVYVIKNPLTQKQ